MRRKFHYSRRRAVLSRMSLESLTEQQRIILKANYEQWKRKKITAVEFMRKMGLKKNTFYKIIKEFEAKRH
jgi:hypothetical protein